MRAARVLGPLASAASLALVAAALVVAAVLVVAALALAPSAARAAEPASTTVVYVSGGSVYLGAGRDQGVAVGDSAEARRTGRRIAGLVVREVTSRRALCDTFAVAAMPVVGDDVLYTARALPADSLGSAPAAGVAAVPPRPLTTLAARRDWRGRVGAGYLVVSPDGAPTIRQPTFDARVDHADDWLDLHADVRGRSTSTAGTTDNQARVYRLSLTVHDAASSRRLTLGRQVLSAAPGAAFFDGGVAEMDRGVWTFGLFGGGAPEPDDFTPSFAMVQSGAFLRARAAHDRRVTSATVGFLDARYRGTIDRDMVFVDASHTSPSTSLFLAQEIDLNPGWKQDLGDPSVSATATFFHARQALGRRASWDGGFDNRRNVREARDRVTAETEFDDRYRRGAWTGLRWEPSPWLAVGGSAHYSGGLPHETRSVTGTAVIRYPSARNLSLRLRGTRMEGGADGWMRIAELEWGGSAARVVGRAGWELWNDANGITETSVDWQGLELERPVGRRVYAYLLGERRGGDPGRTLQSQAGLSYNF